MPTRIVLVCFLITVVGAVSHAAGTQPVVDSVKDMASGLLPLAMGVGLYLARKRA